MSIRMLILLRFLNLSYMFAHLFDTSLRCYVAADLACLCPCLNFMCLCHTSEHPRGPFGLMPLMQVQIVRIFPATMLPEWHDYLMFPADMLIVAPATPDRHAALFALSLFGTFILFLLMLGYVLSCWFDSHLDHYVSWSLQQYHA